MDGNQRLRGAVLDVDALRRVASRTRSPMERAARSARAGDVEFVVEIADVVARGMFECGRIGAPEPQVAT